MNNTNTIHPSSQIESILPQYVVEQYGQFVNFMTSAIESEERIGFSQDILQNLQTYRDFDTYQKGIVKYGTLTQNITAESDELTLENGYGFPDENGVLYIDDEIILYRTKEGNTFYDLKRGSSGTTVLPTFTSTGTYIDTCPKEHLAGTRVSNLSVLFLASMLETIYDSFFIDIDPSRVVPEINQSTLLSNIRDFFQAKGTKLGIESLFKMIFGDTGTDVSYPGDQIIIPSVSTYAEDLTCRVIPVPSIFYPANEIPRNPSSLIGCTIRCKSYNDDITYGESIVEYTKSYPYEQSIQYDLLLNDENITGEFIVNPSTFITTNLENNDSEIIVDSTNGFPESGILFVENEGIVYSSKTDTQFLGCTRGYFGQVVEHESGTTVRGPYYIQGDYLFQPEQTTDKCDTNNTITYTSRSWVIGLVSGVQISDPGILHRASDTVLVSNPITNEIRSDIELYVSEVSKGNISDVFIQDPGTKRTSVGDLLYFNNTSTFGSGAAGKVSWVHGECIEESTGCEIRTRLVSHRQQFNLSYFADSYKYVFVPGQFLETSGTADRAISIVSSWDQETKILIVQTISQNLIVAGDTITDSRGNNIIIAPDYIGAIPVSENIARRGENYALSNLTILDYQSPTERLNGDPLVDGDLWWSVTNGRLYIFYDGYWVTTQPSGSRPIGSAALNIPTGVTGSDFVATGNPPIKSQIIISDSYPTSNPDGSSLRIGDLWWSSVTGLLYVWNSDSSVGGGCITCSCDVDGNPIQETAEWVCTDPTSLLSWGSQGTDTQGPGDGYVPTSAVSFDVNVVIGNITPLNKPDGTLWWNSERGRLFVRYQNTWVIANPFGSESGAYSYTPDGTLDNTGDQSFDGGPIISLSELADQKELFFRELCDFFPGDIVRLGYNEETVILEKKEHSLILQRDNEPGVLVNGTSLKNLSRGKLTLQTKKPHKLQIGDSIRLHSLNSELDNTVCTIMDVGTIIPAAGIAILDGDQVSSVFVIDGGANYDKDFYLEFIGGGGAGAIGIGRVSDGAVVSVDMISGGKNYTSSPEVRFNFERSVYFLTVYTDKWYPNPNIIFYETNNELVENYASDIELISGGDGYKTLPTISGIYKREIDRASFRFKLNGTSLQTITVLNGGTRYDNPRAVILDPNGKGSGGSISLTVNDGVITAADIVTTGIDYENPYVLLIEEGGKFIPETTNIGKILSFRIAKEGRNVDPNILRTEILDVETRLILQYPVLDECIPSDPIPTPTWQVGDMVYIGDTTTAYIKHWEPINQVLSVNRILGQISIGDTIRDENGNTAIIGICGKSEQRLTVSGISRLTGKFITDKSMLNSNLAKIQDGEYYQLFSYVIESSKHRRQYQTLVNDIIHPAGFVYFSKTKIEDSVTTQNRVDEPFVGIGDLNVVPVIHTEIPRYPRVGHLWFNKETGSTYIYYGDRVSGKTYWVDITAREEE